MCCVVVHIERVPSKDANGGGVTASSRINMNASMDSLSSHKYAQTHHSTRYVKSTGNTYYFSQFQALILKRVHHNRRNFKVLITNLLLPCFFVGLSMTFTTIKPRAVVQPSLQMSPGIYKPNHIFFTYVKKLEKKRIRNIYTYKSRFKYI